jgi:hypothetical protein
MTRSFKDRQPSSVQGEEREFIPKRFQHAVALGILILSLVLFFREIIFHDKTFLADDALASHSFDTLRQDAEAEGIFPLWNPYIFCGMPAYGSLTLGGQRLFDLSGTILQLVSASFNLLNSDVGWVLFYYVLLGLGMYLLAFRRLQSTVVALFVALAVVYSTYIIIWIMTGHNTKIAVIAFFPFVLLLVERLLERWKTWWFLLLILCFHCMFIPAHVQMIFYSYLVLGLYGVFLLVQAVRGKHGWKSLARGAAAIVAASAIALMMDADKYLSVLEYNPYSIRGSNPIVQPVQSAEKKTVEGGLDYEYATSWSLAPGEVMTFLIPSWYGFGVAEYRGPLSNNQPIRISTYLGPQPFTHAPQYMGVVVLVLACIGFWRNRKEPFVQFAGVVILFSLLVAFGKEFSFVYDLMYRYFPMFNKFRVPSMILVLVQLFVPMLAGYGVASFLSQRSQGMKQDAVKRWKALLGGLAAVAGMSLMIPSVVRGIWGSFFGVDAVARRFGQQQPAVLNELHSFIGNMVVSDVLMGALLLLIVFGALYLYLRSSMSLSTVAVILIAAAVGDLWRVSSQPMETHPKQQFQQYFTPPDYVNFIKQDTTAFRVMEFVNGEAPYNNTLAYWRIQSAYGYQGAKMRAYQDMVDVVGLKNPLLWSLMNVKYIISNQPDTLAPLLLVFNGAQMKVYHNTSNLPRAYFVNRYQVAGGKEILDKIAAMAFDPRDVVYFMEDPKLRIDPPQAGARVESARYGIQDLQLRVSATGSNLLVLSETYYPVGWKAFIDGMPTEIYRVNYLFRGIVVPPGEHTVTMKFEPRGFYLGRTISLAVNVLLLGAIGFVTVLQFRKKKPKASSA